MDLRTLAIVTCLSAATMATIFGIMSRLSPADHCLKDWALAGLLFLANSSFAIVGLSYPVHSYAVMIGVANACTIAGYTLMLSGIRLYLRRPPAWRLAGLLGLSTLLVDMLPGVRDHIEWRLLLGWPIIVIIHAVIVVELWRDRRQLARPAMKLLLALAFLYALQQLVRLLLLAHSVFIGDTVNLNDAVQTAGRLLMFVYLVVCTMVCAVLVLQDKADELKRHADVDPLTGWHNRRSWVAVMDAEFQRSRRTGVRFHAVMFDIDHFKSVNDRHGHDVGDQAIRHVTATVAEELRIYDHRFRVGGEEFVVCAPGLSAAVLAERIRARVAAQPLRTDAGELRLTVSVGFAEAAPEDEGWQSVLQRADAALYGAKHEGRNRVQGAFSGCVKSALERPEPHPSSS